MPETANSLPVPPVAERRDNRIEQVGRVRNDVYAWMKDPAWQEVLREPTKLRADIRAYLEAENAYTAAHLVAPTQALQETLFAEMRGRIKEDDASVPEPDGPFAYVTRFRQGGQYPILARIPINPETKEPTGPEQVMLDGDVEGKGKAFWQLRASSHSPDHKWLAYAVDEKGSEYFTIRFRNLETGKDEGEAITESYGSFDWAADSRTVFWIWRDENARPSKVYRHTLGTPQTADALIYEEKDPGFFLGIGRTPSGRFLALSANSHTISEIRLIDAAKPEAAPVLIAPRTKDLEYNVVDHGDTLYIHTNADGAVDFKIMKAPLANPVRANWTEYVPHRPGSLIEGLYAFKGHLVRAETVDALPRLVVTDLAKNEEHVIAFAEEAYNLSARQGLEWDTPLIRTVYSSPTTPNETVDYHMTTRTRTVRKRQEVPSGHDPKKYVVRRFSAPSWDGAQVPVTVLHRADLVLDGKAPLLLYGYGSYGISMPAGFSTSRLSLVDRGMVYAIAHVRGGKERGYQWYLDGKAEKKPNTFKDFIAAGEELVRRGFTSRGRIVGQGGSAGGLLMGAVANMAPDLFAGIIADVPFVDALNTMSDASLPLTPPEWPEWGNPLEDPKAYDLILSYSPYDQVAKRDYPPILALGGLTDPRVTYWEPAKWVAALRHTAGDAGPYFLKINMDSGHGGASGRFDSLKEVAIEYAFALWCAGLAGEGKGTLG